MDKEKDNSNNLSKNKGFLGFNAAFNGIKVFFLTQTNARIHLLFLVLVIVMGVLLKVSTTEWLIIVLCIGMVFTAEMMNTAIEHLTDLVSPTYNKTAGIVKDIAAGAVLLASVAAAVAGFWIFLPKLLKLIGIGYGIG